MMLVRFDMSLSKERRVNWEMNDRIEYLYINDYRHRDLDREMIAEGAVKLSPEDILDRILVQRYT